MNKFGNLPVKAYIKVSEDLTVYMYKLEGDRVLCDKVESGVRSIKRWYNIYTTSDFNYADPLKSIYICIKDTPYFLSEFKDLRSRPKLGRMLARI